MPDNDKIITVTEVDKDDKAQDKSGPPLAKVKVASLGLTPEQIERRIREKQTEKKP